MIKLPEVTLALISSIQINDAIKMLQKSNEKIEFATIKFISHEKPDNLPNNIQFNKCEEIKDTHKYSQIVFKYLTNYIDTYFCLLIQPDSCIIHPELWNNNWLKYDYIGAPWAIRDDAYICHDTGEHVRVGNGGFSLRSKKIMNAPLIYNLPLLSEQGYDNEDGNICVYHRVQMKKIGIKFAPVDVAAKFSFENPVPENGGIIPFGYHKHYPSVG